MVNYNSLFRHFPQKFGRNLGLKMTKLVTFQIFTSVLHNWYALQDSFCYSFETKTMNKKLIYKHFRPKF